MGMVTVNYKNISLTPTLRLADGKLDWRINRVPRSQLRKKPPAYFLPPASKPNHEILIQSSSPEKTIFRQSLVIIPAQFDEQASALPGGAG